MPRCVFLLLPALLWMLCHSSEGKCGDDMYEVDSTCCFKCGINFYVRVNCSQIDKGTKTGTQCEKCTKCGNGQRMVSPCTTFSDAICADLESNTTPTVIPVVHEEITEENPSTLIALYSMASMVLLVIIVATTYKLYMNRSQGAVDPAEEPLKPLPVPV